MAASVPGIIKEKANAASITPPPTLNKIPWDFCLRFRAKKIGRAPTPVPKPANKLANVPK